MDNPILWVMVVVIVVLCVVMVIVAGKSFGNREKRMKEFYTKANRQKEHYEKYKGMSAREMRGEPAADVLEGLAVAVQMQLSDELSANEAFMNLPDWQRYAYAGYYFFYDSKEKLSAFFRKSGEPLLGTAVECLEKADLPQEVSVLIAAEYEMLDDNNEAVSVDNEKIAMWDAAFAGMDIEMLRERVKQMILDLLERESEASVGTR